MTSPGDRLLHHLRDHEALRRSVEAAFPARFSDLRPLGTGGMGAVLRAWDSVLQREVALKCLRAGEPSLTQRQRLLREAQAMAALRHPHVVSIHDLIDHAGEWLLVMDCVDGESLAERLERGPLPIAEAVRIATAVAEGLEHAHQRGILHRDLKPGNVLLGADGRVLLTDFGLAKLEGPTSVDLTRDGQLLGTPEYLSPEQLEDARRVDARSDVYGLGATFYAMLTGETVFHARHLPELAAQILDLPPPDPRALRPEVPEALAQVCLRCLAKSPARRFPSAAALAEALRDPPPPGRSWSRRLAATGVALAVLAGALAAAWSRPAPGSASATPTASSPPASGALADRPLPTHGKHPLPLPQPSTLTPLGVADPAAPALLAEAVRDHLSRGDLIAAEQALNRLARVSLALLIEEARADVARTPPTVPHLRDAVVRCAEAARHARPAWRLDLLYTLGDAPALTRLASDAVAAGALDAELALEIIYVVGNVHGLQHPAVQGATRWFQEHPDTRAAQLVGLLSPPTIAAEEQLLELSRAAGYAPGLADVLSARRARGDLDVAATLSLSWEAVRLRPLDPWVLWNHVLTLRAHAAVTGTSPRAALVEIVAVSWLARAVGREPIFLSLVGEDLMLLREYAAARRELQASLELQPDPSLRRLIFPYYALALVGLGERELAAEVAATYLADGPLTDHARGSLLRYPDDVAVRATLALLE